jgi:hypothetical protein
MYYVEVQHSQYSLSVGEREGGWDTTLLSQSAYTGRGIPPLVEEETLLRSSDWGGGGGG